MTSFKNFFSSFLLFFFSSRLVVFLLFSFDSAGFLGTPEAAAIGLALGSCRADLVEMSSAIEACGLVCPLSV